MDRTSRILVTGAGGMVGGALVRRLRGDGFTRVFAPGRADLDLRDEAEVAAFFAEHKPEFVFMIAARVGGIGANIAAPVEFLADNARITLNLFEACRRHAVSKTLFLGSSCIYPRAAAQPMTESMLMTGPLEPTNEGYALAKILGLRLAAAYFRQYGLQSVCLMPCNVYGTGDHFDLERSHVMSALIRRFVEATAQGTKTVTLWGTGSARREFIHVDDLVEAIVVLFDRLADPDICNVGTGTDVSIRELAETIAAETRYSGEIAWDTTKPDGMPRKCLDVTRQTALGFVPSISLREGIRRSIDEYRRSQLQASPR
jgi:GDP-L-fucose synthase